tara:strand:- start:2929 stop:4062 length:1134 start_codon:yes stop_codon:yes gene_type:complete
MLKIGITGQSGFIGNHIYNKLGLFPEKYDRVIFKKKYFSQKKKLQEFTAKCDIIIHLAAINRCNDLEYLYNTNIELTRRLLAACEFSKSNPHIIFSSSIQENNNSPYGKSKLDSRKVLESWAKKNKSNVTSFLIPNVFGPFCKPNYNSFISTFSFQLISGNKPSIDIDNEIQLVYIDELVNYIMNYIDKLNRIKHEPNRIIKIPHTKKIKVSKVLIILKSFAKKYLEYGQIPNISSDFNRNLFLTFISHIKYETFFPFFYKINSDNRGSFIEMMRLESGGQISFSTTKPGITRGNHFHTRKSERFCVIKGKAKVEIRKIGTKKKYCFKLDSNKPSFIDMPVWYTHNITNIGDDDLYTIFWISEHFDEKNPDTFLQTV